MDVIKEVVDLLREIKDEEGVPKKVKERLGGIIQNLNEKQDLQLKVNKCLDDLDEMSEDVNLPGFIRTQIWNASSLLEKVEN